MSGRNHESASTVRKWPELEVLLDVVEQRSPHIDLVHVDAVQAPQILLRVLEELPLLAVETGAEHEPQTGDRVEPHAVQQLHEQVDVAVGLGPIGVVACIGCDDVRRRIEPRDDGHHDRVAVSRRSRTDAGQSSTECRAWRTTPPRNARVRTRYRNCAQSHHPGS